MKSFLLLCTILYGCSGMVYTQTTIIFSIPECTSVMVGDKSPENQQLQLFPNPAQESLHVKLNTKHRSIIHYLIYNKTGQVLIKGKLAGDKAVPDKTGSLKKPFTGEEHIDVSRLRQGIYVFSLITPEGVINRKFIIN